MNEPSLPRLEIADMVAAVGDKPYSLVNLARTLLKTHGDRRMAMDLYRKALSLAPDDPKLRAICEEFLSRGVGSWYFTMVEDHHRHQLYDQAFRRVIKPGDRVLDIGAGTGLFAMMAARAGAGEVIACERDPIVADTARAIVEKNGLSHVVRIVEADSRNLEIGKELAAPADVLVWDNLGNNLIGVGALDTLEDAKRRLMKPDAVLIPQAADIRVGLAHTVGMGGMGTVEGFDLSLFDSLRRQDSRTVKKIERRSDAATLFSFDAYASALPSERDGIAKVVAAGGEVNAIAQWIHFHVLDELRYDSGEPYVRAFGVEAHPVKAFEGRPGATVTIGGRHDRLRLWLWLQEQ